jgi:hypothetical protein
LTVSEGMCMAVGSQVEHVIVDGSRMWRKQKAETWQVFP